jgi:protein SCO1/2
MRLATIRGARCARRRWLAWAGAATASAASGLVRAAVPAGQAPAPTGWVKPRPALPDLALTTSDVQVRRWSELTAGKITAMQLIFTGCLATCPPQGAMFAALASAIKGAPVQLLSISIDALGDTPQRLAAWQARFGRQPGWQVAVPREADVNRLMAFLQGTPASMGSHTSQVFVCDARGHLAWRSGDLPPVEFVAALLTHLQRSG